MSKLIHHLSSLITNPLFLMAAATVVLNLLGNAIRWGLGGGESSLFLSVLQGALSVVVADRLVSGKEPWKNRWAAIIALAGENWPTLTKHPIGAYTMSRTRIVRSGLPFFADTTQQARCKGTVESLLTTIRIRFDCVFSDPCEAASDIKAGEWRSLCVITQLRMITGLVKTGLTAATAAAANVIVVVAGPVRRVTNAERIEEAGFYA